MRSRYKLLPLFIIAVFVVLVVSNPFWREMQIQRFSRWYWLAVYCGMTAAVSCIAFLFAPIVAGPFRRWGFLAASVAGAIFTMIILGLYSYLIGTRFTAQEADNLLLRDLNHFFRDYRSIVFMFIEVPIFGLIAGVFEYVWHK
jgi:hypothetical protein